ncbi:hypothetical protein XFF6992_400087 [Xanthomonas citri pv. fuscans]|nr:hypothetical protein XFF6992_400087 [Xanthomonas citri pv. fuscans]SOO35794.1 hypothetical protein XFF6994_5700010 [Xanthomonas citri pv. fuscans]
MIAARSVALRQRVSSSLAGLQIWRKTIRCLTSGDVVERIGFQSTPMAPLAGAAVVPHIFPFSMVRRGFRRCELGGSLIPLRMDDIAACGRGRGAETF